MKSSFFDCQIRELERRLRRAWSDQTSSKWTPACPASGQCGVTALVVQDKLGGEILKTPVGGAWHFYNRVGGWTHDFTADQFTVLPEYLDLPATREEAMADTTEQQYQALAAALASELAADREDL